MILIIWVWIPRAYLIVHNSNTAICNPSMFLQGDGRLRWSLQKLADQLACHTQQKTVKEQDRRQQPTSKVVLWPHAWWQHAHTHERERNRDRGRDGGDRKRQTHTERIYSIGFRIWILVFASCQLCNTGQSIQTCLVFLIYKMGIALLCKGSVSDSIKWGSLLHLLGCQKALYRQGS